MLNTLIKKQAVRSMHTIRKPLIFRIYANVSATILVIAMMMGAFPPAFSQGGSLLKKGTTRAVVIGISDYQNESITDLQFAHADARAFADFLQTPAGGGVSTEQIMLLLNEEATQGQIAAAFTWLLEQSQNGDRAIIYFSGHGDVENQTLMNFGFLLAYNAPASCYFAGGAFPVDFLKSIITTLSSQKGVEVLLISDACRAGKLAGSAIGGTQATAKVMADQFANEIKILSCQPNEYSLEGEQWGGGRGVFSYHLLNGLTGLADRNADLKVSLLEIERYLEDIVPVETAPLSQIPLTAGNKGSVLTFVDEPQLTALRKQLKAGTPALDAIASKGIEADVLSRADTSLLPLYQQFKAALANGQLLYPAEGSAYQLYLLLAREESLGPLRDLMRRNLAAKFQDEAQTAINDYLASEPRELASRWAFSEKYQNYPAYLGKAAELLGSDHYLYTNLKARQYYFEGLNLRLKALKLKQDSLFYEAVSLQKQTLELEKNAAYAYNELGLIYQGLKDYETSIAYLEKANALSPTWMLPINNLGSSSYRLERYDQAEKYYRRAAELEPDNPLPHYNLGNIYSDREDFPAAAQAYQKAVDLNPSYSNALYNLAWVCSHELGEFGRGEKLLQQVITLEPEAVDAINELGELYRLWEKPEQAAEQYRKAIEIDPAYPYPYGNLGELAYQQADYDTAKSWLLKYIDRDATNPDIYYLLALTAARQNDKQSALSYLQQALANGYEEVNSWKKEEAFAKIKGLPEFKKLVENR